MRTPSIAAVLPPCPAILQMTTSPNPLPHTELLFIILCKNWFFGDLTLCGLLLILGDQDWDRASFQIGVSDLIQLLTEGRLRHACGPAQYPPSPLHLLLILNTREAGDKYGNCSHYIETRILHWSKILLQNFKKKN